MKKLPEIISESLNSLSNLFLEPDWNEIKMHELNLIPLFDENKPIGISSQELANFIRHQYRVELKHDDLIKYIPAIS